MLKALKVRLYPTAEQRCFLDAQFGAVRLVYNKSLWIMSHPYRYHQRSVHATKDMKPLLPIAKRSRKYAWMTQYDSIALQEACRHLNIAFSKFFTKKAGYPSYKKRQGRQSSYHCTGIKRGENWIKIPKLGTTIKAVMHRPLEGKLKSITMSRSTTGKYYASLLLETPGTAPAPLREIAVEHVVGVDVGITDWLVTSRGNKTPNPRPGKRAAKNLRRKQKSLSRKVKGSRGRQQARVLVAKSHEKVANTRKDFQHKITRRLIDESQAIIVETLKIKSMMKNRCLAKAIGDAGWGQLIEQLSYKAIEQGKHCVKIDQWFPSSKTCASCHYKLDKLPLSVRQWECPHCCEQHDRDINAAKNIQQAGIVLLKAEGLSVSANGGLRQTDSLSAVA